MHRRSECRSRACRATAPPIATVNVADLPASVLEEARRRGEDVTHAERCTYCRAVWSKGGMLLGELHPGTTKMLWIGPKKERAKGAT